MRSFSISSSREYGTCWLGFEAFAAAAASWMSTRSNSESSPFGVSVVISGAMTVIEPSLPGRFSLPPTKGGLTAFAALPLVAESSGVSEFLRLGAAVVDARGRF